MSGVPSFPPHNPAAQIPPNPVAPNPAAQIPPNPAAQIPPNPAAQIPQTYTTNTSTYAAEAKQIKSSSGGDFWDKWPGSTDGSPTNYLLRIAPSLTPDGTFAREVMKFFIPKNFSDPSSEKDVLIWPEGSEQQIGPCPILEVLGQLQQLGVKASMLEDLEPTECFYAQGWFRDESFINVTRTKPYWINLKKSMYNKLVQYLGGAQAKIYGDPFDPNNGSDVSIVRSGQGRYGTKYETSIVPCPWLGSRGPVHPDASVAQEMLSQMTPLDKAFPAPSGDDLQRFRDAAQRIMSHFSRFGVAAYATAGAQIPQTAAGTPQWPQQQQPTAFPNVAGPVGVPGVPGAPGVPGVPGAVSPPPTTGAPGTVPFEQGTSGSPASQTVPENSIGGEDSFTTEKVKQLVAVWGIHPDWVTFVNDDLRWCTVEIPADGGLDVSGTYYYSLIEEKGKRGALKGLPKMWRTNHLRGIKKHTTSLAKKLSEQPISSDSVSSSLPSSVPLQSTQADVIPVAEPVLPTDSSLATSSNGSVADNQQPGPSVGTQVETNGGQRPVCFFDQTRPQETGFFVVSARNPLTCATCPWEQACQQAANSSVVAASPV